MSLGNQKKTKRPGKARTGKYIYTIYKKKKAREGQDNIYIYNIHTYLPVLAFLLGHVASRYYPVVGLF
jgi:hypothetical protein